MPFFLRYTANAELDLERKTSLHGCDGPDQDEDAELVEGFGWAIVLNGLCGYQIEADNIEEAKEEAIETVLYYRRNRAGHPGEGDGICAYLFEGELRGDCVDGDLFMPTKLIANISELTDAN